MEEEKYICKTCELLKLKSEMAIKRNKYSGVGLNCKKCETEKVRINKNKKKEDNWWGDWFDKRY
jgi:RNase P subunit RPR2